MARKKSSKTTKQIKKREVNKISLSSKEQRVGDSYISMALGVIVVVAIAAVVVAFVKGNQYSVDTKPLEKTVEQVTAKQQTYTIQEGEGLWDVAVKFYGDGYKWVDLVKANNLENPDIVSPGTVIIIPKLESQESSQ